MSRLYNAAADLAAAAELGRTLGIKADLTLDAFAESSHNTEELRQAVRDFLADLDKRGLVTGWYGIPLADAADYMTGYIIGTMRGEPQP